MKILPEHTYSILYQPEPAPNGALRGSTVKEAQADIVIRHDGAILKDRFGNAAEVLEEFRNVV